MEGHQLLDGLFMNYFQCDQIQGDYEALLKFYVYLAKGYSNLMQVKRHMYFQLEKYLAVIIFDSVTSSYWFPKIL